jgi:hypothetical protein
MSGSYSRFRGAAVRSRGVEFESLPRREEPNVGLATAGDEEFLAARRTLHVPAEAVAEIVGPDDTLRWLRGEWSWWDSNPRPLRCQRSALPS